MANGTSAEDMLVGKVRPRLKREFEFAFKTHSEISGSLGRTRSGRARGAASPANKNAERSNNKRRFKGSGFQEEEEEEVRASDEKVAGCEDEAEAKSGVVELGSGDEEARIGLIESVPLLLGGGINGGDVEIVEVKDNGATSMCVEDTKKESGRDDLHRDVDMNDECEQNLQKSILDNVTNDESLKEGSSGSMPILVDEDSKSKLGETTTNRVLESNSESEVKSDRINVCEEGNLISSAINVVQEGKGDLEGKGDAAKDDSEVKGDAAKGDSEVKGDAPNICLTPRSSAVEASLVVVNDSNGRVGEKAQRRFTRSSLKQKTEAVEESTSKDGVEGNKGGGISGGFDDVGPSTSHLELTSDTANVCLEPTLRSCATEASPVLVNDSNGKVGEKPLRRFTRSLLKQKTEAVGESTEDGVQGNRGGGISAGVDDVGTSTSANSTIQLKKFRNDASKKFPSKLKDLLESGILEGLKVKYMRGSKAKGPGEASLHGVIQGSGIQCFCHACKGNEVVTPTLFELHAGSSNKRPPEYIYLENGNTLRDVMNACKDASLGTLEESLRLSIGCSSLLKSAFCLNCRGSVAVVDVGKSMILCSQCRGLLDSQACLVLTTNTYKRTQKPVPLPKSPDSMVKSSASRSKSQGRLTTKDLRMHKLVFEEDVLPDGTEVAYYSRGQKLLVGYKKGFGIFCSCCNSEVSPSQFEAHAGWASRRKPYLHIYTSNGVSLHELAISLSKTRKFATHENDDLCQICRDGGDLLCCDACPRSYHKECLGIQEVPTGKWYCKFCLNNFQKEKFVERNANAIAAGRVAGVDPIEQITRRCIRIVKTLDAAFGGCVLCRGHDFSQEFGPCTVLLCDQCEKEYHVGCLKDHKMEDLKELPKGKWFCCSDCKRIHTALEKLVVRGEEKLPDSCLNIIKEKTSSLQTEGSIDVRWRLLNEKIDPSGDTAALLSEALAIYHERFDPILVAGTSGKTNHDLIPSMVFGENFKGQELGGMYCAVLIVNQVVVSSAIIRFFGNELAELPLVATSSKAQGLGYFQALFTCLEKLLGFLNVKNMVLPSAEEAETIWTNKFGFKKLTQEEFVTFRRNYQMMVFQGTSMLHKPVPKCRIVGRSEGG